MSTMDREMTLAALQESQINTLQQIGASLGALTRRLEGLTVKVDDVRERLVRLEAQEAGKLVDGVRGELQLALGRLDALESQRDRVVGVAWFWGWISRSAPWIAAGLAAILAVMGLKGRSP